MSEKKYKKSIDNEQNEVYNAKTQLYYDIMHECETIDYYEPAVTYEQNYIVDKYHTLAEQSGQEFAEYLQAQFQMTEEQFNESIDEYVKSMVSEKQTIYALCDKEGLQTMRTLARNMVFLMKSIALGKEKLEGSLKDYVNIFSRTNGEGESFRVEGNYFSLDVSGVKRIVKFRDKSLVQATSSNGSHSQLFGFPGDGGVGVYSTDCKVPFQFRAQANEILMNNLNFKGNGTRDNNSDNLGGLIGIKTTALHFVATNVNSSDTFITIFSRPSDDDLTQSHTFIDRSRWYDSYSSMLFFHKTSDNNITNSIMQGAGGSLMLLSESGANNHYRHNPTSANVSNSFLESYVNGLESWFVDKSASSYVPMLASYDLGIFGKLRTDYGTSKKYVKVQDGSAYVNMIAISLDGDKPFANTLAQGEPLTGYLSIDDQKVLDYTELNSPTGKLYPYAQTMKGMGQQGLIFNSSAGGLAAAGDTTGNELLGYSTTFASHPYKSNFVSQFAAQNALLGQLANFNMFPASQHALITGAFRGNGVTNVADEIDANWRDLTSGEYLSITLQADKTQQYLGVVLGYNA